VALLGNPVSYEPWSQEKLQKLKDAGFNAIQLNTAWLSRPHDEALNLRDVVALSEDEETSRGRERRAQLKERCAMAKAAGFRTIFHFGSPYMWRNPETGEVKHNTPQAFQAVPPWFDSSNPKVVEYETALLRKLRLEMPDVDDILVYTYDQDAWQASEFGLGPSRGVPLHKRLPAYLHALHREWTNGREGTHTMWWEPWELSAGQVLKCMPDLPRKGFGLMLHSNIAEVQIASPVDVWLRNTGRVAEELGIPVVVEGFFSAATEEIQPLYFPFPRLTDEQHVAMLKVPGCDGVKEYFGIIPTEDDLNLAIFTARVNNPTSSTQELLQEITARFGDRQSDVLKLMEHLADGMQLFPWDVSWYARLAGTADVRHSWRAAAIRGQQVETPSWESTRRAHFMKTDDRQPHPFLLEDVQLRCEMAVAELDDALTVGRSLLTGLEKAEQKKWLEKTLTDVEKFRRVALSYALHIRESNAALLLRADLNEGRSMTPHLIAEMRGLLDADVKNQDNDTTAVLMRDLFKRSPEEFLKNHLLPHDKDLRERGIFTLTTR